MIQERQAVSEWILKRFMQPYEELLTRIENSQFLDFEDRTSLCANIELLGSAVCHMAWEFVAGSVSFFEAMTEILKASDTLQEFTELYNSAAREFVLTQLLMQLSQRRTR